jgi:hypothetical protein
VSQLRHRFRIVVDGTEYTIITSARDMAAAQVNEEEPNAVNQTFRLLHAACLRLSLPNIPSSWEEFADVLDDLDDLEPEAGKSNGLVKANPIRATA